MEIPTMPPSGADMPNTEVWVFAVCDAGCMQFVRFFAMEAAARTYAKHWLADQFAYTLIGADDQDWDALNQCGAHDASLSWLIASNTAEAPAPATAGSAPDPAAVPPMTEDDDAEFNAAVARAGIGVLAEADVLTDTFPALDQHRAVALIAQQLRDWAYLD